MYCCRKHTITLQSFINALFSFELGSLLVCIGLFLALLHEGRQRVLQRAAVVQLLWLQQEDGLSSANPLH